MQNKIHSIKQFITHYMHDHLQDLGNSYISSFLSKNGILKIIKYERGNRINPIAPIESY